MPSIWDDIKKTVKESAVIVKEKTEEYSKIGKLRYEIMGINKKIEKTILELGEKVYDLMGRGKGSSLAQDSDINKAIKTIDDLKKELALKEKEIEKVKKEAQGLEKEKKQEGQKKKGASKSKSSTSKTIQSKGGQKSSRTAKTTKTKGGSGNSSKKTS